MTDQKRKSAFEFLRLIERSPDVGDGWREVSDTLWVPIRSWTKDFQELIELHPTEQRVGLTHEGQIVMKWLV